METCINCQKRQLGTLKTSSEVELMETMDPLAVLGYLKLKTSSEVELMETFPGWRAALPGD